MLGHVVVVSCLAMRAPVLPVSLYSLLYRDSKQKMGSSPAKFPAPFFFSHHFIFFFILFYLLEDHQIFLFFFHFLIEPKIFFLNIFFSYFTHCKTLEKNISPQHIYLFFLFRLFQDHFAQKSLNNFFSYAIYEAYKHITHTTNMLYTPLIKMHNECVI